MMAEFRRYPLWQELDNRPHVDASERKHSHDAVQEVQERRPQTHQLEQLAKAPEDPYTALGALCKKSRA